MVAFEPGPKVSSSPLRPSGGMIVSPLATQACKSRSRPVPFLWLISASVRKARMKILIINEIMVWFGDIQSPLAGLASAGPEV